MLSLQRLRVSKLQQRWRQRANGRFSNIALARVAAHVMTGFINTRYLAVSIAALSRLRRNTAIEAGLGAVILVIVAVLGVTPPGVHQQPMPEMQYHSH